MKRFRLAALAVLLIGASPKPEHALPKDVELLIPKNAVSVGWAVAPATKPGAKGPDYFDVDNKGNPWVGFQGRTISNALKPGVIVTDEPYKQFVWTEDNFLMVTNGKSLGYLVGAVVEGLNESVMKTGFKKIIALPGPNFRLYRGLGSKAVLLCGPNASTKQDELVHIQVKNGVAETRKLLASQTPITHVFAAGGRVLVALGRGVARYDPKTKALEPVFVDAEPIREVVYSPTAGYFYATASGLGFYTKGLQYRFMKGSNLRIRLRNNQLFVLLPQAKGLIRIDGLPQFASLKPQGKKAP